MTTAAAIFAACGDSTFDASGGDASIQDGSAESAIVDGGGGGDAIVDGGNESGPCSFAHDPLMIPIPNSASPSYCIDFTEVTRSQYQTFIDAIAADYVPPADPRCNWNSNYNFDTTCLASLGDGGNNFPITCIDWCDALSYCAWAGKRLCGRIGSTEPLTLTDSTNTAVSQWENACSANGTREFPYGNAYIDGGCNLPKPTGTNALIDTASPAYAQCVGGYSNTHDMAGNAAEWVDACNDVDASDAGTANCDIMGGSFGHSTVSPPGQCVAYDSLPRELKADDVGFRCCSQ